MHRACGALSFTIFLMQQTEVRRYKRGIGPAYRTGMAMPLDFFILE